MNILEEANGLINGDRQEDYGDAATDFARTAAMWSAILGTTVTPQQIPLCMIALKISRQCHRHKRDNLVDIAGYVALLEDL